MKSRHERQLYYLANSPSEPNAKQLRKHPDWRWGYTDKNYAKKAAAVLGCNPKTVVYDLWEVNIGRYEAITANHDTHHGLVRSEYRITPQSALKRLAQVDWDSTESYEFLGDAAETLEDVLDKIHATMMTLFPMAG